MVESRDSTIASRRAVLTAIPGVALGGGALLAPAAAQADPDAMLVRLGRELEEAWTHEREVFSTAFAAGRGLSADEQDALIDAACDKTSAIVGQIERTPARALKGLQVKARAIQWAYSGQSGRDTKIEPEEFGETTDMRLAASIVNDLNRLVFAGA